MNKKIDKLLLSFLVIQTVCLADFAVTEMGSNFNVTTPYGSRMLIGDIGLDEYDHYQFEMPLENFKPDFLKNNLLGSGAGGSGGSGGAGQGGSEGEGKKPYQGMGLEELFLQANNLYNQGRFQDALKFVDQAIQMDPMSAQAYVMKGSLTHVMGNRKIAQKYYEKALELDPKNEQLKKVVEGGKK